MGTRVLSFITKSLELAAVGALIGLGTTGLSNLAIMGHKRRNPEYESSYKPPEMSRSAIGLALFYGLHAHTRYQVLGGIERFFFERSNYLWAYLTTLVCCRVSSGVIGEAHRPMFAGLPTSVPNRVMVQKVKKPRPAVSSNVVSAEDLKPKVKKTKGFEITMA